MTPSPAIARHASARISCAGGAGEGANEAAGTGTGARALFPSEHQTASLQPQPHLQRDTGDDASDGQAQVDGRVKGVKLDVPGVVEGWGGGSGAVRNLPWVASCAVLRHRPLAHTMLTALRGCAVSAQDRRAVLQGRAPGRCPEPGLPASSDGAPVPGHAVAEAVDAVAGDAALLVHAVRHALVQRLQRAERVGLDLREAGGSCGW